MRTNNHNIMIIAMYLYQQYEQEKQCPLNCHVQEDPSNSRIIDSKWTVHIQGIQSDIFTSSAIELVEIYC